MFPILAVVLFLLSAFGVDSFGEVDVTDLGLACLGMSLLLGTWPVGAIRRE